MQLPYCLDDNIVRPLIAHIFKTPFQKIFKKNSWLGEKEEEVSDEFDSEVVWEQIVTQRRKRGYVDYSVLEM